MVYATKHDRPEPLLKSAWRTGETIALGRTIYPAGSQGKMRFVAYREDERRARPFAVAL